MTSPVLKSSSDPTYAGLIDSLATGALALVGAGSSARLGYPAWKALIARLEADARTINPNHPSLAAQNLDDSETLLRAEACEEILGVRRVGEIITELYGPRTLPFDSFHELLVTLPFLHFLTTNYEYVLEGAQAKIYGTSTFGRFDFDEKEPRAQFVNALWIPNAKRSFVHLHGSIDRPDHIVLTLRQYREQYTHRPDIQFILQSLFAHYPVVFIGFGLSDPYFMKLIDALKAYFGQKATARHFALVPSTGEPAKDEASRYKFLTQYGIQPIFYDPAEHHKELGELLSQVLADVTQERAKRDAVRMQPVVMPLLAEVYLSDDQPLTKSQASERMLSILESRANGFSSAGRSVHGLGGVSIADRTPLDAEIDDIFRYVKQGQPDTAFALYTSILDHRAVELNDRLRYRLYANRGNAQFSAGKPLLAAEEYLRALTFHPYSKDARALEALAYSLRGEADTARMKAELLCRDEPDFARAQAIRLKCIPPGISLRSVRLSVPRKFRRDAEIAHALAGIAEEQHDLRRSELYAKVATQSAPEWADAWLSLGSAILLQERATAAIDIDRGLIPVHPDRVKQAGEAFSKALDLLSGNVFPRQQAVALFNRSSVKQLFGDKSGCLADLHAAYDKDPKDPDFAARLSLRLEQSDDFDAALRILEAFDPTPKIPAIGFVWALVLFRRKMEGDLDKAATLLTPLITGFIRQEAGKDVQFRAERAGVGGLPDIVQLYATVQLVRGERSTAISILRGIPVDALPAGLIEAQIARLTAPRDDEASQQEARSIIAQAIQLASGKGDYYTSRDIAMAAESLHDFAGALSLLREIIKPCRFNSDTELLLRCAYHAQDHLFILEFCKALRESGVWVRDSVGLEINTLVTHREFEAVITLMSEWLRRYPDDKVIRLALSKIGIQRDDPALIERDATKLPSSDDVHDSQAGATVVSALQHTSDPTEAVRFAYRIWRRFSEDQIAQHLLIMTALQPQDGSPALYKPQIVDSWSAVTVKEAGQTDAYTFVIEEGADPRATLGELGRDHPMARAVWGRKVGETVVGGVGRPIHIISLENKILHRARLCMKSFEKVFQESNLFRTFNVQTDAPPGTHPKKMLGEVWDVMEADSTKRKHLLALYEKAAIPVSLLARELGKSVLETLGHLAGQQGTGILVSAGDLNEATLTASKLKEKPRIVIDESAIATLFLLGLDKYISTLPFKCIVPESALQEIRTLRRDAANPSLSAYIGVEDGKLFLRDVTPEERQSRLARLESLIETLTKDCEVVGGAATLKLPAALQQNLPGYIGVAGTDAIAIANDQNLLLWTDDFITGRQIAAHVGLARTWTQPIIDLSIALDPRLKEHFGKCNSRLFLHGYQVLRLSVSTVIELLEQADWAPEHLIGQRVLSYLAMIGGMGARNCVVSQLLLIGIWRKCSERKARRLIPSVLNAIGREVAGPYIARPLYKAGQHSHIPKGAKWNRLKRLLRSWRSQR